MIGFMVLHVCLGWLLGRTLIQRLFPIVHRRSLHKSSWLGLGLLFIVTLVFQNPILASIDDYLLLNDPPQPAEIIWVLGVEQERYAHAVDLYLQGYGQRLVMSLETHGAPLLFRSETIETNVDAIRSYAERRGVPIEAMMFLEAENTYQEALLAKNYLKDNNIRSALIVSSPAHMRRTSMIFNHLIGDQTKLTFSSVPLAWSDYQTEWWTDRFSLGRVIYEYLSLVYYYAAYVMF